MDHSKGEVIPISHFTVLVIGDDYEGQLQPYHEFECTGFNDEYVQTIDITEKVREEYETDTVTRLKDADGALHEPWDDRFFRDPTEDEKSKVGAGTGWGSGIAYTSRDWGDGQGDRPKVRFVPEGFEEVEVPRSEAETFVEFLTEYHGNKVVPFGQEPDLEEEHKYGYVLVDENGEVTAVFDRTNPDAKWDWYQVGGRWSGYFKLKANAMDAPGTLAKVGGSGVFGNEPKFDADIVTRGDVDSEGMRDEAGNKAGDRWDRVHAVIDGTPEPESWDSVRERHESIDDAREFYGAQERIKAVRDHDRKCFEEKRFEDELLGWSESVEKFSVSREVFVQEARDSAICPYAYIYKGEWRAPGDMGWWGFSSDTEESKRVFLKEFNELWNSLPDDTVLTLTDCHI